MSGTKPAWAGVFPAVTTQFHADLSVDFPATQRMVRNLIEDGVDGIIACGSVGENSTLLPAEKRDIVAAIVEAAAGRVPVLAGLGESNTAAGCDYARDMEHLGANGMMVMPPMIYGAAPYEIGMWFRTIAAASDLPIMLYNNPPAYRNDLAPQMAAGLADVDTIVAIKESSGDTRRFVDLANLLGGRFLLFCGLDDVILETACLGAIGWVSGLSNVFPQECARLFKLAAAGKPQEALPLYRWIMPLLHLDARADLVQCIKLCEALSGRGTELTRPPRLALEPAIRAEVAGRMRHALETRPSLGA
ncbi:MAG: dihydrodipicolinate synthase family protein [Aliidongia sp.]